MTALPRDLAKNPVLARWITVHPDGTIGVRVGKVELGQGILTALAQLAADELDVTLAQIRMLPANTATGPDEGYTAGSMSIVDSGPALRLAAANVRALFVGAAAEKLNVDPAAITVDSGRFTAPTGATTYAELAHAVDLNIAADPGIAVKSTAAQRIAGTSVPRLDLPDKVAGRPRFIHDLRLPGQHYGRVVRPPSPGARLNAVEATALRASHIVFVRDGAFLGVIAPDEAAAVRAAETVRAAATWDERDTLPDDDDLDGYLRAGPHETVVAVDDGAGPHEGTVLSATYSRPFLAHASMAPSCGVARWSAGGVEVWTHSQGITPLRDAIATTLHLDPETVTVQHVEGAGCYGHNAADDAAFDAVLLARAVPGVPVQVMWTRQDELSWAPFGSAMTADVTATLGPNGRLTSWTYDLYSQGHTARPGYAGGVPGLLSATMLAEPAVYPPPADPPVAGGAGSLRNAIPGYDVGVRRITGHRLLAPRVRSSALRALGAHLNVFAIESFVDEAALVAGRDPLDFRLAQLADERGRRVLRAAADAAGWGTPLPDGTGRGLGYARYKERGAYCAVVADVEAEDDVRVRRLVIAVDVGRVVNPDGVRNQIEGGATQATSWTLKERVRFDRRRVTSVDWETYPILRFSEAPEIVVELVGDPDTPSTGAGEAAQGPTAAAIGNALANAIGVRVRDLPLDREAVIRAIGG
ncbi:xanthine dehydrogenase family protein molybdopterin-binding subunit [Virgisporangium aurantiacum]|uniref:Oxidoreductase n=1 Tax=Virgisporangium aurantiacum TaxID=175570 RepID=A0A8J4E6B6_9ACTN|nr:molybdopterin cofactor-binding domain-containing protein [Virgisporangium aurantiacum]GIJ60657.1 oxidoreductase [Virgisporangium aurantiacum]